MTVKSNRKGNNLNQKYLINNVRIVHSQLLKFINKLNFDDRKKQIIIGKYTFGETEKAQSSEFVKL